MKTRKYATDLSDAEWTFLEPHLPALNNRVRPRVHSLREILRAVFYVLKSGCPWRLLPETSHHERPSTTTFVSGVSKPTAQCGHSRYTIGQDDWGGEAQGYLGGKKVHGRKRHLLVDTEGLALRAKVNSARVPDQDGIKLLLEASQVCFTRLSHVWVDADQGRGTDWVENVLGLRVEVVRRTPKPAPEKFARIWAEEWAKEGQRMNWQRLIPRRSFEVLPRRWVVERTFSWL